METVGQFCSRTACLGSPIETLRPNIYAFLRATYGGAHLGERIEVSVIDAIHAMTHNVAYYERMRKTLQRDSGGTLTTTIGSILEADDGSRQPWMNPAYMGIFRRFLPIIFDEEPLNTPLEQRHLDRIETYRLDLRNQPDHDNLPYSGSALAHDDGTRQEIVDYSSEDEGFEGFEFDRWGQPLVPFTTKEIETREQCSNILQILDDVMEKGGTVTDGNYLEMCNILKELYKN